MKQSIHQQIRDSRLTQTSLQDFFAGEGRSSLSGGKYGLENMVWKIWLVFWMCKISTSVLALSYMSSNLTRHLSVFRPLSYFC